MNKLSTLAIIAVALLFLACSKEKKESALSLAQTVEFNGKKIPMVISYSPVAENDGLIHLDSLVFEYDNKTQTIHLDNVINNIFYYATVNVSDYNFDGYMDVAVFSNYMMAEAPPYNIFIYNPQAKSYYLQEELSKSFNVRADAKTQTVKTASGASGECHFGEYKWINGELKLIYSESTYFNNNQQINETKALQDGKWVEKKKFLSDDDWYCTAVDYYKSNYDKAGVKVEEPETSNCPGNVKLLKSITQDGQTTTFEYDDKNRIVKMDTTTFTYNNDDVIKIGSYELERYEDGGRIDLNYEGVAVVVIYVNRDGYSTRETTEHYSYDRYYTNGNLIKFTGDVFDFEGVKTNEFITEYKYDDKKSPFNCNTPKWVIQHLLETTYASKNNVIERKINNVTSYRYEYDSDGFPTKRTETGDGDTKIITFKYCNLK